jgi:cysteinyl-tRNA synthetase
MRLYNTATRALDELPPPPGPVRMYFCGPTVYQRIHVGNARPFVVSMWLKRWLENEGYDVTLAENITDINDKIYAAAPGASAQLAEEASHWYVEDTGALSLGRPDREPKASEAIPEIVALIEELIQGGLAYPSGGDVYYRVSRFGDYGALSRRQGEDAQHNPSEEQEPSELKEDPRDFAVVSISSSRTTRTRSPSRGVRGASSPGSGCTTACSGCRARRCRSRSATSSRCAEPSTRGAGRRCSSTS